MWRREPEGRALGWRFSRLWSKRPSARGSGRFRGASFQRILRVSPCYGRPGFELWERGGGLAARMAGDVT